MSSDRQATPLVSGDELIWFPALKWSSFQNKDKNVYYHPDREEKNGDTVACKLAHKMTPMALQAVCKDCLRFRYK